MLGWQIFGFALADTVLARTRAFHADGALGQPGDKRLAGSHGLGIVGVHNGRGMKVAIADVADDRGNDAKFFDILLGFYDAFSQTGDRNADVGCKHILTRPCRLDGPVGVVARLPQAIAVFLLFGPIKPERSLSFGKLLEDAT